MTREIRKVPSLLIKRLPHIVFYSALMYGLIVLGQLAFYRFMPASYFLNYYSAQAQSAEEHSAVPFKACRTKRGGDHVLEGNRVFYKVPEGESKANATQVAVVQIRGAATANQCADLFVPVSQFDHETGYYYFRTIFEFKVHGVTKRAEFETNVYAITQHQLQSVDEIEQRIKELQIEIDTLRQQLEAARAGMPANNQTASPPPDQTIAAQPSPQPTPTEPPDEQSPIPQESILPFVKDPILGCPLGVCI